MKVTVCQLNDDRERFEQDWIGLLAHVEAQRSDCLLLPEMPFSPWLHWTDAASTAQWAESMQAHDRYINRLAEMGDSVVLGSRPVLDGERHNEGFIWDGSYRPAHRKVYLPDEPGFFEGTWYRPGGPEFNVAQAGELNVGYLICSELWFMQHCLDYARQGIHILATPRATELGSVDKWIAGGRTAAVVAGAFSLSSNRCGKANGVEFGGAGWIIDPDGEVLGVTSAEEPFVTVEIDPAQAEAAKKSYPRYIYV